IGGQWCVEGVCIGASAGVYADVNLVKASAPSSIKGWISLSQLGAVNASWNLKSDLNLSSLDGELGVFAKGCIIDCKEESAKLLDWAGFSLTYNIANFGGTY